MSTIQSLSAVCNVTVQVSPVAAATPTFNQGLIVGPSTIIPSSGANSRVRSYSSTAAMLTGGWTGSEPEFLAAQFYFDQSPAAQIVQIGRQDLTQTETILAAIQACRAVSQTWYLCMAIGAVAADHEAVAAWIESAGLCAYFYVTADTAVLNNTTGNVALTLQTAKYSRSMGIYSTTQSGAAPNNAYIEAAAMGIAMGLSTGLANSNFTMKFRIPVGMTPESLTLTQVQNIENANCNLYLPYPNGLAWLEQGVMASGRFFDSVVNADMLASDLQYTMVNALVANPSIPHTQGGEAILISLANQCCERAVNRGYIAPAGTWNGIQILNVTPGLSLPKGYMVQAQPFTLQSPSDAAARKAMPIYVTYIEAGSMHSLSIAVSLSD